MSNKMFELSVGALIKQFPFFPLVRPLTAAAPVLIASPVEGQQYLHFLLCLAYKMTLCSSTEPYEVQKRSQRGFSPTNQIRKSWDSLENKFKKKESSDF